MVIGLVGLAAMALPAMGKHHGALFGRGAHHAAPGPGLRAVRGLAPHRAGAARARSELVPADAGEGSLLRFVPSPRAIFSVLALFGAFGNAGVKAFHLPGPIAAPLALVPALLVEWVLVRPLWNMLFRLHADPSSPLDQLVLAEARAEVPFRNGKGIVSTVHDGRRVQLAAELRKDQETLAVRVGDRLIIEAVDRARERVTVSIAWN